MHLAALARRMPMPRPSLLVTRQALAGFATGVATVVAYAALQRVMRRLAALASQASAQPEEQTGAEDEVDGIARRRALTGESRRGGGGRRRGSGGQSPGLPLSLPKMRSQEQGIL